MGVEVRICVKIILLSHQHNSKESTHIFSYLHYFKNAQNFKTECDYSIHLLMYRDLEFK